jgi:hypothetical protein
MVSHVHIFMKLGCSSWILLFKRIVAELVNTSPLFYRTLRSITVFTIAQHWIYPEPGESTTRNILFLFFTLTVSSYLCPGLSTCLLPSDLLAKTVYEFLCFLKNATPQVGILKSAAIRASVCGWESCVCTSCTLYSKYCVQGPKLFLQ